MNEELSNKLAQWAAASENQKYWQELERKLRKEIFDELFPKPKEGTNRAELGMGYNLVATYPIDRKVDLTSYTAISEQFEENKIPSNIIKYEPKLEVKVYKAMTGQQQLFFDQALIIKPGSIQMKIEPPKEK